MSAENKTFKTNASKAVNVKKGNHKKAGIKSFLKSRKAKSGAVATAIVAVVIVLVVVFNIITGLLVDRFPDVVLDLTTNNSYALTEDTIDYVAHLNKDVTVYVLMPKKVFESQGKYFVQAQKHLQKMKSSSGGKLSLEYVDLTSNPTFTSAYKNVDWQKTSNNYILLVECGKQYRVLTLEDCFDYDATTYSYYGQYSFTGTKVEQAVVTAILNVTTDDKVVVDMITGNQEQDYSAITKLLENNAYQVNEVSLATKGLDDDAVIAIMYAPAVDLDEKSVSKLEEWLNNDGKYGKSFIYLPTADMPQTPNLDEFLGKWGMKIDKGYVYETGMEKLVDASTVFRYIVDYTDYYTDDLKNAKIPVLVSEAHEVNVTDENIAHSLLTTSDDAGIIPIDAEESWTLEDGLKGESLSIAAEGVMSNENDGSSRVITFGSYLMFNSAHMSYNSFNNSAYLMNILNTISGKDDVGITIESKSFESTELGITDVATQSAMLIIFVIVIPVAILIIGFLVWLRRRNK